MHIINIIIINIALLLTIHNFQYTTIAMTTTHEVSAVKKLIGNAKKSNEFDYRFNMAFLREGKMDYAQI